MSTEPTKESEEFVDKLIREAIAATGLPEEAAPALLSEMWPAYFKQLYKTDPINTDALIKLAIGLSTATELWARRASVEMHSKEPTEWFKSYLLWKNAIRPLDN